MTAIDWANNCKLLDGVSASCLEIRQALNAHFESTTNANYKIDIEKDMEGKSGTDLLTNSKTTPYGCGHVEWLRRSRMAMADWPI